MTKLIATALLLIAVTVLVSLVMSVPMSWLWNYVAPAFNLPQLSWQQMWAVMILCDTLFKSSRSTSGDSK